MQENSLNLHPEYLLPYYKGKNGVLDGGDCAANTFSVLYVDSLALNADRALSLLTTADGWPVRSPDTNHWSGREKRCSRDQLTPYLCYTASNQSANEWFYMLLKTMAKHGFLFANNSIRNFVYETEVEHLQKSTPDVAWRPGWKLSDFLGPDIWQIWARGLQIRSRWYGWLTPIILLGDLQNFCAVLPYLAKKRQGVTDERNLGLKVHFAANYAPNMLSKFTYKLYKSTKPQEAFTKFWTQPGEPAVHVFMNRLYE